MAEIASDSVDPRGKPWCSSGTSMEPNVLLMCKLLLALLLLHHFSSLIQDPYIPYIRAFDGFLAYPGLFENSLKIVFYGAAICLIFNLHVRWSAIALGIVVLLVVLASKSVFRNHIFIVGCLFLLSGLHRRGERPWLLYLQIALMYLGAFVNKILQNDWRNGQFMDYWMQEHLSNPFYETFSVLLPGLWFAALLSWAVILGELVLTLLFLNPRWRAYGVWLALAMHLSFFLVVGRTPFGHFFEDIILALMAFLAWPAGTVNVRMGDRPYSATAPFQRLINLDRQFRFSSPARSGQHWFEISIGGEDYSNGAGLFRFLKYNSATYFALFGLFNGLAYVTSRNLFGL
jgi:hypothetical protein